MPIEKIQQSVEWTWKELVPSLAQMVILLAIAWIIAGPGLFSKVLTTSTPRVHVAVDPETERMLDKVGVFKLAPFLLAFVILLAAHITKFITSYVGHLLPPNVEHTRSLLMLWLLPIGTIRRLAAAYPGAQSSGALEYAVSQRARALTGRKSWLSHRRRGLLLYQRFVFIKFLMLWVCAIATYALFPAAEEGVWLRALTLLAALLALCVLVLRQYVQAIRQEILGLSMAVVYDVNRELGGGRERSEVMPNWIIDALANPHPQSLIAIGGVPLPLKWIVEKHVLKEQIDASRERRALFERMIKERDS
jgi:hypothetical protein